MGGTNASNDDGHVSHTDRGASPQAQDDELLLRDTRFGASPTKRSSQ